MSIHLDPLINEYVRSEKRLEEAVREFERRYISVALEECGGNRSLAARRLGIHRNTLLNKIRIQRLRDQR